jgi:hypothetical protein
MLASLGHNESHFQPELTLARRDVRATTSSDPWCNGLDIIAVVQVPLAAVLHMPFVRSNLLVSPACVHIGGTQVASSFAIVLAVLLSHLRSRRSHPNATHTYDTENGRASNVARPRPPVLDPIFRP